MRRGTSFKITPSMLGEMAAFGSILAIVASCLLAKYIYLDLYLGHKAPLWRYLTAGLFAALIANLVFSVLHARRNTQRRWTRLRFGGILAGLGLTFLILIALGYAFKIGADFSRGWMFTWFAFSVISVELIQRFFKRYRSRLFTRGYFKRRVAIYGVSDVGQQLLQRWANQKENIEVVGVYEDFEDGRRPDDPLSEDWMKAAECVGATYKGGLSELIRDARGNQFEYAVIAVSLADRWRIKEILADLYDLPISIHLAGGYVSFDFAHPRFQEIGDVNLIEVQRAPLAEWSPWKKAAFDYAFGTALLLFLLPVFVVTAIAIKIDSRGPVFFRQRRHGFNNQEIEVLKFRTMYVGESTASDGVPQATKDDPRVTRVGRFLRTTSLDELPQLINVLRGEMSIVGPRPHAIEHNVEFGQIIDNYASRHKIKPGITGWAQVNGYRGETDIPEKMMKRVEYDRYYIENWSIGLDFKIAFWLTPPTLLRRINAY